MINSMDTINSLAVEISDKIDIIFATKNQKLTIKESDKLYTCIVEILEKKNNYPDYLSYN